MSRIHLSLEAQGDLEAIWRYIAVDNVDAADRWDQRLRMGFEVIALSPAVGHRRPDLTDRPLLFWPVENYLIIYRAEPSLEVIAVTRGARDVPHLLSERTG